MSRSGAPSPARPLRILQLYPKHDWFTGAAIQMFDLARGLRLRGHEVVVATQPSAAWARRCAAAGVPHAAIPMTSGADLRSAWHLAHLLRLHAIDVVHAHKGRARTLTLLARLLGAGPALVLNRGVSFPLDPFNRLGYLAPWVHAIVAVSESIKRSLVAAGVPAAKVDVIHSGTDTERFHPGIDGDPVRRALELGRDDFLVTQVGVRSSKGNDDLIDAMATVVRAEPRARLLLVGARRPEALLARAAARGIGAAVAVLGYREDVAEILAASDCCVDASHEGLGLTGALREALAVETAVVATALEGNPELVRHGETGLLVPPRRPDALAGAILTFLRQPALRRATARAGRLRVEEAFSLRAKLDRTETLYRRVCAWRRAA